MKTVVLETELTVPNGDYCYNFETKESCYFLDFIGPLKTLEICRLNLINGKFHVGKKTDKGYLKCKFCKNLHPK